MTLSLHIDNHPHCIFLIRICSCQRKTGGLVIWRSGSIIILYRGVNYKYPYYCIEENTKEVLDELSSTPSSCNEATSTHEANLLPAPFISSSAESLLTHSCSLVVGVGSPKKVRVQLEGELELAKEADKLLDGLGPRFTDWWGCDPLPVDADLLPAVVPGFRKPFRLLPFGIKPKLTDQEMTILKRLGRPLPCHFALGKNNFNIYLNMCYLSCVFLCVCINFLILISTYCAFCREKQKASGIGRFND